MKQSKDNLRTLVTLDMMNSRDRSSCAFCGHKFGLGEPVVMAWGPWGREARLVHERDAIFDKASGSWVERRCFEQVLICREGNA